MEYLMQPQVFIPTMAILFAIAIFGIVLALLIDDSEYSRNKHNVDGSSLYSPTEGSCVFHGDECSCIADYQRAINNRGTD